MIKQLFPIIKQTCGYQSRCILRGLSGKVNKAKQESELDKIKHKHNQKRAGFVEF